MTGRKYLAQISTHTLLRVAGLAATILFACGGATAQAEQCPTGDYVAISGSVVDASGLGVSNGTIQVNGLGSADLDVNGNFAFCEIASVADSHRHFRLASLSSSSAIGGSPRTAVIGARDFSVALPNLPQALEYEDYISQIEKRRTSQKDAKPRWQIVFESAGGAALITVLLGGIIGGVLTNSLQRGAKEREIELLNIGSEKQLRRQSEEAYLEGQIKVVREILELVTSSSVAAENLVVITTPRFQPDIRLGEERKSYRAGARAKFNAATPDWKRGCEVLGATLGTYHSTESPVFLAWLGLREATTKLLRVSKELYDMYYDSGQKPISEREAEAFCQAQRVALEQALTRFSESVFRFRAETVERSPVFTPTGPGLRPLASNA